MPVAVDVFISYARGDEAEWVREKLYEPLLRRRTKFGRRPEIFFDTSLSDGIGVGSDWLDTLSAKMKAARNVVAVFSPVYFQSKFCQRELKWALSLRDQRQAPEIMPLMLEPCLEAAPLWAMELQAASVSDPRWLDRLCAALDLSETSERRRLVFDCNWESTQVNRTLPPVIVRVVDEQGRPSGRSGEVVRLQCEGSVLQGPDRVQIADGVAAFDGLSLSEAGERVVLTAHADGTEAVSGQPFAVASAATSAPAPSAAILPERTVAGPTAPATEVAIPATGLPAFLPDEQFLAVLSGRSAHLFDISGRAVEGAKVAISGKLPRLVTGNGACAVVDWPDRIGLISVDGRATERVFSQNWGLAIIGGVAIEQGGAIVGLWNGEVARLSVDGGHQTLFRHSCGVQALAAEGDAVYVFDFEGDLCLYAAGEHVRSVKVERKIRALTILPKSLVAVCEKAFYQLPRDLKTQFAEPTAVGPVAAALTAEGMSIAIGESGKGIRIDAELNPRATFYAARGAVPLSADRDGKYCALSNGDGTFTLLASDVQGSARAVYSHTGGMAVAPSGLLLAVSERTSVRLVDPATLAAA